MITYPKGTTHIHGKKLATPPYRYCQDSEFYDFEGHRDLELGEVVQQGDEQKKRFGPGDGPPYCVPNIFGQQTWGPCTDLIGQPITEKLLNRWDGYFFITLRPKP
jgi:hypothetical protein